MTDLAQLLRDAAASGGELDYERVGREGRRRQQRPRRIAGALALSAVMVAGSIVVATRDTEHPTPVVAVPTTEPQITTAPTTPPTTVSPPTLVPPATIPPGDERLTVESRLGFAGLGPIKLGMTLDEAAQSAGASVETHVCDYGFIELAPDSGLTDGDVTVTDYRGTVDSIMVRGGAVQTISGIHIGSSEADVLNTYANVVRDDFGGALARLMITNDEGRLVVFSIVDGTVQSFQVAADQEALRGQEVC